MGWGLLAFALSVSSNSARILETDGTGDTALDMTTLIASSPSSISRRILGNEGKDERVAGVSKLIAVSRFSHSAWTLETEETGVIGAG